VYPPAPIETRLRALLIEHRAAVLAHAVRLTRGDLGWAEDVVQETFLRAWRHADHMTPDHGSVRGWLLRVAHNLVMDGYRTARMRRGETTLDHVGETPQPDSTEDILTAHLIHQALDQLPDLHRRALEATYLADQTAAQAAHQLNIPVGTVKSRVFYGIRMLRTILHIEKPTAA
jgi:RNA polymerase sigma-70 factor (ECF subfamily)